MDKMALERELYEKSFDEIYDIVMKQMQMGKQHTIFFANSSGNPAPDEDTYDTHLLMCHFNAAFGKLLASLTPEQAESLDERLEKLSKAARECEQKAEAKNNAEFEQKWSKVNKDDLAPKEIKLLKTFAGLNYSTCYHSFEIDGCRLVLQGYVQNRDISIDEETRNLYKISRTEDSARFDDFFEALDRYVRSIGQTIGADKDDSTAWELDIFKHITYRLHDQKISAWKQNFDDESDEHRSIESHSRKLWACWNIIDGYFEKKHGKELPEKIKNLQKQAIDGILKDQKSQEKYPCYVDVYLSYIGAE